MRTISITNQILRIRNNIESAYDALSLKGATLPTVRNSNNLADTIDSISGTGTTVEYSQVNPSVAAYLAEVTYDPSDYSVSRLDEYVTVPTDYDKSKPAGANVNVPAAGTLILTDGSRSLSKSVSVGNCAVYNIIPGHAGTYLIKTAADKTVSAGVLKPDGALRMIDTQATANVRDLGGWSCDGGTVKYGMLFRGGEIGAADTALFHDFLGIRAELNLRWDDEVTRDYSLIGEDVDFRHINGPWYSVGNSSNWPPDAHKQILNYVMDYVIAGKPLYFHCAAGADRTGTLAFILEAILGMSQSDMDKEYELTSFYTGIATDAQARRRNEDEWKNYMAQFNSYPGSVMRDKVVNWALTLGITIDKINAFRAAMIDGTPEVLSNSAGTVTITKALTNVSVDNTAASMARYQPYTANITPDSGYAISAVTVEMNGEPVNVFIGTKTALYRRITNNLSHCHTNNLKYNTIDGQSYGAALEADTGYTLDGGSISITIGGVEMANVYYSDGKIVIPNVTGDIVITAAAVPQGPTYTNVWDLYKVNSRLNSGESDPESAGSFITGFIPISADALAGSSIVLRSNMNLFNYTDLASSGDYVRLYPTATAGTQSASDIMSASSKFTKGYDSTTGIYSLTINRSFYSSVAGTAHYLRFCAQISDSAIASSLFDGCILTINEEM